MTTASSPATARWKIQLEGDPFDLEDIATAAVGLGARVFQENGKWFLHTPVFDALNTPVEVHDEAERITASLVAVVRAAKSNAQPVQLGPIIDEKDGSPHRIAIGVGSARGRAGVVGVSGSAAAPGKAPIETAEAKRARLYSSIPEVRRAIDFLTLSDASFRSISNALEIVEHDLGGPKAVAALTGVSMAELETFRANANNEQLSGDNARHAGRKPGKKTPSVRPMTPQAGRELVRRIVLAWVASK
jgi:hypothetical protein